jgi:hypothetical protein
VKTYTVFCQQSNGRGTIWIGSVYARSVKSAINLGRYDCARDWKMPEASVHVLGVAAGDVTIEYWSDLDF